MACRRVFGDDDGDDQHETTHAGRATDEGRLTPNPTDNKEAEARDGNNLDDAEEPCNEQRGGSGSNRSEDLRGIVGEGGIARQLHAELHRYDDEDTEAVRWKHEFFPRHPLRETRLFLNTQTNLLKLRLHLRAVAASYPDQVGQCFFISSLLCQPSDGLLYEEHTETYEATGNELQADGDLPLQCARRNMVLDSVIDPVERRRLAIICWDACLWSNKERLPVANTHAQGEEELEARAQLTAHVLGRHLRGEHGNQDSRRADSEARYDSACVERPNRVGVHNLEDPADAKNEGGQDDGPPSSVTSREWPYQEAAEEGSCLEDGDTVGVYIRGVGFGISEIVFERTQSEHAACKGLTGSQMCKQAAVDLPTIPVS